MLDIERMTVRFGGVTAVDELSLTVPENTVLGLVGPNGSGKSTLLNALCGVVRASGTARIAGRELPLGRPHEIRTFGLARAFQAPQLVAELEVLDNVLLATDDRRGIGLPSVLRRRRLLAWERGRWRRAMEALEMVGIADHAHAEPGSLSYGSRRLVELARVIAGNPRVILLDEPAAGLNAAETDHLAGIVARLTEANVTMLLVEHKIDFVDRLCDALVVLDQGRKIAEGPPVEVWRNPDVIEAYLGARPC